MVDVSISNFRILPSHPPVTNDVDDGKEYEEEEEEEGENTGDPFGGCSIVKLNSGPEFIL
jgi:hypothetical protein